MGLVVGLKSILPDVVGFRKAFVYITEVEPRPAADVPLHIVNHGSIFLHCLLGIKDGGQFLVLHVYQVKGFLGYVLLYSGYGSDLVTNITHLINRQRILVGKFGVDAIFLSCGILGSDYCLYPGQPLGPRGINVNYPSVGIGASQDLPE